MHDIIHDLCINLRDSQAALEGLRADANVNEFARLKRNVELCEGWLRVAGGEGALDRLRTSSGVRLESATRR